MLQRSRKETVKSRERLTLWKRQHYGFRGSRSGEGVEFLPEDEVRAIQKEYMKISERLCGESWRNDEYRQELLLAAEGICVMAELSAKLAGYELERVSSTEEWLCKYRQKWLEKNKASELYRIEEMFLYYEQEVCLAV